MEELARGGDEAGEGLFLQQCSELFLAMAAKSGEQSVKVFDKQYESAVRESCGESAGEDFGNIGGGLFEELIEPVLGVVVWVVEAERLVDSEEQLGQRRDVLLFVEPCDLQFVGGLRRAVQVVPQQSQGV